MQYLRTQLAHFFSYYLAVLREVFQDVNDLIDNLIESETGHSFLVALIITTPFIGFYIFYVVIQLSD